MNAMGEWESAFCLAETIFPPLPSEVGAAASAF